jgi:hypothetical protein
MTDALAPRPTRPVFVAGSRRRHRTLSALGAILGLGLVAYLVVVIAALTGAPWVPDLGLPGVEPSRGQATAITDDGRAPWIRTDVPSVAGGEDEVSTDRETATATTAAPLAAAPPTTTVPAAAPPASTPTTAPPADGPPVTLPPSSQGQPPADPGRPDTSGRPADPGSNGQGTTHRNQNASG